MAKSISEMSAQELKGAAKTLSALVYTVAGIGLAIAGYILYSMINGNETWRNPLGTMSIMTLVVSTVPVNV